MNSFPNLNDGKISINSKIIDLVEMEEKLNRKLEINQLYWLFSFVLSIFLAIVNLFVVRPIDELKTSNYLFKTEIKTELSEFKTEIRSDLKLIHEDMKIQAQRTDYLYQQSLELMKELKSR